MCGIVGIVSKDRVTASVIKSMNDSIIHRGPDDEGFLVGGPLDDDIPLPKCDHTDCDQSLAFGHRRLAIVDLSAMGHQPMCYRDRYWIVYNGEVYNHVELRRELETQGYSFASHTDTEVILAAYDAWGTECLKRFNGMWAFVLYDQLERRVFISRDRFGIKPLYYYQHNGIFVFASEIKALLRHPHVTREPNLEYCREYLERGAREYLKETAFKDIYRFGSACFLECDVGRIFEPFRETRYWKVKPNLSREPYDEDMARQYADQYYRLLDDAVRLRLRADVNIGSALSGGLDSSSIVLLVNQQLRAQGSEERQETFSSVYRSAGTESCDESAYIDRIAEFLGVKSHQVEPRAGDIIGELRRFVYYLDTPAANTLMSSWHTYRLTRACGVTVTLDGQGADEQMAGYLPYLYYYFAEIPLTTLVREVLSFQDVPGALKPALTGCVIEPLAERHRGCRHAVSPPALGKNIFSGIPQSSTLRRFQADAGAVFPLCRPRIDGVLDRVADAIHGLSCRGFPGVSPCCVQGARWVDEAHREKSIRPPAAGRDLLEKR